MSRDNLEILLTPFMHFVTLSLGVSRIIWMADTSLQSFPKRLYLGNNVLRKEYIIIPIYLSIMSFREKQQQHQITTNLWQYFSFLE